MFEKLRKILKSLKNSYNNFLVKTIDESNAIIKVEKFCKRYLILSSNSFEDYINGNQTKVRIVWKMFSIIILILFSLRCFALFLSNHKLVQFITCDFNYKLGNPQLISLTMWVGSTTALAAALHLNYEEWNKSAEIINFLQSLKTKSLNIKLNARNQRRFGLRVNLMTEYMINVFHKSVSFFVVFVFTLALIIVYIDSETKYSLFIFIFWSIVTILLPIYFYSMATFEIINWYLSTLFLKYKFTEILELIERSVKTGDKRLLMNSIHIHNSVEVLTHSLNKYFKELIFIVYYMATPSGQLICYVSHEKSTVFVVRILAAFLFVVIFSLFLLMNLLSANVIHSAHKSYPLLYTFMIENKLKIRDQLRVEAFIEHLSGPRIGFYCLNMFPMNNYEFYKYISIASHTKLKLRISNNIVVARLCF